jgi:hypothetical protein
MSGCHNASDIKCNCVECLRVIYINNQAQEAWKSECKSLINLLMKRMDELERKFNILLLDQADLKSLLESLAEDYSQKKPHICPVCKGLGSLHITSDKIAEGPRQHYLTNNPCHACEGKGVLWR